MLSNSAQDNWLASAAGLVKAAFLLKWCSSSIILACFDTVTLIPSGTALGSQRLPSSLVHHFV